MVSEGSTVGRHSPMNNLAMLLATSSDPKIRNPKEAVSLGEKAVALAPDNASYLDTLATAYFEASHPDKAAETEKRALTLKPDNASYRKALEKYQAAKPISEIVDPKTRNLHLTIPIVASKPKQ